MNLEEEIITQEPDFRRENRQSGSCVCHQNSIAAQENLIFFDIGS